MKELYNKNYKVNFRNSAKITTDKGIAKKVKEVYEANKEELDKFNNAFIEEYGGELKWGVEKRLSAYIKGRMQEGMNFNEALVSALNSDVFTGKAIRGKRNAIVNLKKDSVIMNQLRRFMGWQYGYNFLDDMKYADEETTRDLNAQIALTVGNYIVAKTNSPKNGVGGGWVIYDLNYNELS